jgi:hypothetical protein
MARPISIIQNQIIANLNSNLPQLNSPSQVALYNLFSYVVAVAINVLEQLNDIFTAEIDADIANTPPGTPQWWQKMMLAFQYNANTPQVLQMINYAPQYPTVIPADNIIAQCGVSTYSNSTVFIKVAGANPNILFNTDQKNAMKAYIDMINFAGISWQFVNYLPDLLTTTMTVYYNGQYANVISTTIQAAITNYLANIGFDGNVVLSDLMEALKAVPGVEDIVFNAVTVRSSNTPFTSATYLVQNSQTFYREFSTVSGMCQLDTTDSTITYTIQD